MKLAGIIFLIATIVYFLTKWKKTKNGKSEINKTSKKKGDENKKTDDNASGTGYWKKNRKSLIFWIIILQFIVLNLVYPGEWFGVKKTFWFFAPRISARYAALKEYRDIVEIDKKNKLSDIREKIRKFERAKNLSTDDIKRLNDLTRQAEKINDVYKARPTEIASAKPKEEVWDWTFEWEAAAEHLASDRQKIVGRINDAQIISRNDNVLKFRYKRPSGKIVNLALDRDDPKTEFYFGRASQNDLYIRVWLLPDEKGNFKGQFDNGPGKVSAEVFLKKKL